jgi:membrane protein implicated in regulation of membrane protease activity
MRYGFQWTPGVLLLGLVVVLPMVPGLALITLFFVALAAAAVLVALAGAAFAAPYLLVRTVRRRLAERHVATEGPGSHALPAAKSAVAA